MIDNRPINVRKLFIAEMGIISKIHYIYGNVTTMSYQYSNGLCHEALRRLGTNDEYESRLSRAFSEMGVSREGDTSPEIWKEWKELQKKYHTISGEIYQQRKEGINTDEMTRAFKELGESLVDVICGWMEYNAGQIAKGILSRRNKAA